jgi:hypothetical protein
MLWWKSLPKEHFIDKDKAFKALSLFLTLGIKNFFIFFCKKVLTIAFNCAIIFLTERNNESEEKTMFKLFKRNNKPTLYKVFYKWIDSEEIIETEATAAGLASLDADPGIEILWDLMEG